jgi:uncharacterized membrane protein YtjA (UPF0391 family)
MLRAAIGLFVIAVIAGALGFGGVAAASAGIAKIFFYVSLVLAIISVVGHLAGGRSKILQAIEIKPFIISYFNAILAVAETCRVSSRSHLFFPYIYRWYHL